jgi:hypothetical protein
MSKKSLLQAVTVLLVLGFAAPAFGCPVCFGETDSPMVHGVQASILFMVAVTYTLIVSGLVTFFVLRRKALRQSAAIAAAAKELS